MPISQKWSPFLSVLTFAVFNIFSLTAPSTTLAQDQGERKEMENTLEEVVVTARRREESVHDLPDSITVFTSQLIENAGIDNIYEVVNLTPNIIIREDFRAGVNYITMRGITTSQYGWPSVSYVVDGVPSGSQDAISQGTLEEIERIEILKGPQSAMYGSGAIAGAINVISKRPTNDFEARASVSYASGNDFKGRFSLSGPIAEDRVFYKINAYHRSSDGLIESTDGVGLDFVDQSAITGRLIFDVTENVTIDLRANFNDIDGGATYQERILNAESIEDYPAPDSPGVERGIIGEEYRRFEEASAAIDWETSSGSLSAILGYSNLEQGLYGSLSRKKPPELVTHCGPVGGIGEPPDCFQKSENNIEAHTADIRFTSASEGRSRWLVGASLLERDIFDALRGGPAVLDPNSGEAIEGPDSFAPPRMDIGSARFWGVYGQLGYDISPEMELTVALRYDENTYETTNYSSDADFNPVDPIPTPEGVVTQENTDSETQPKIQLSYDWSDNVMTYASYSRGFRSGFYNWGDLQHPETTDSFEVGFKSSLAGGQAQINGAVFSTDYSEQQFTFLAPTPPFRFAVNLPETSIVGMEIDGTVQLTENLVISTAVGLSDAQLADGFAAPFVPAYTFNMAATYNYALNNGWETILRADYRRQGPMYLERDEQFKVSPVDFVNLRLSLQNEQWRVSAYADNLFDEIGTTIFAQTRGGYIRMHNKPRAYGIEVRYDF